MIEEDTNVIQRIDLILIDETMIDVIVIKEDEESMTQRMEINDFILIGIVDEMINVKIHIVTNDVIDLMEIIVVEMIIQQRKSNEEMKEVEMEIVIKMVVEREMINIMIDEIKIKMVIEESVN